MTANPAKVSTIPTSNWERLRQIIAVCSFSEGDAITLASGKSSNFYFDMKQTMLDPEGLDLLAELILDKTESLNAAYVGGLEMGAVPVAVAVLLKSKDRSRPLKGFWVRKEAKTHGTRKRAEGYLQDGSDVLIVDDVTTSGGSVLQAIREVKSRGCNVKAVITIVDREEGAEQKLRDEEGIELISLFKTRDFQR